MNLQQPLSLPQSYLETSAGKLKAVTIILGTFAVGLGYTQRFYLPMIYKTLDANGKGEWYDDDDGDDVDRYDPYDRRRRKTTTSTTPRVLDEPGEPCSPPEVERFFLAVTIIALILSLASLRINSVFKVKYTRPDATFHMVAGAFLILAGLSFIGFGAYNGSDGSGCNCSSSDECKNTYQIVAGLFTLCNGAIYVALGVGVINKKSPGITGQNPMNPNPTPSQVQNMPNRSATPSQQIPVQRSQQNMGQFQQGPNPVQKNVGMPQQPR